ncbi:MAG TPA: hypothetical protein IAA61_01305 [Candidatus Ornithomonoglobus merdipullorum]|uniref:Uncharacterized protein n=1 Tax=Candidatus Ornithomonoglobus merdipullorum TaxID=2840895 RepID=A0A9D1MAE0_9FIRM|nr:hypothetical protein [Candidatus Ornithomonoglobus merdipullorum]
MRLKKQTVKYVIICILSSLILGMLVHITALYVSHPVAVKLWRPCVPNEETAIRLAQIACKSYWNIDIEKDAFVAIHGNHEFNDEWQIRLKNDYDFNEDLYKGHIISNDSGVFINTQDGTIKRFMIYDNEITSYYELKELYQRNNMEDIPNEK